MIRQKILQQLLEWIECNLEHPISIEDIAQKSGYSRRNIQLLFRNFMHVPLGEYIRKRRLCRAAILVRLTAKSMLDIALSLHFDSQQSFSREFKKLFGCSPREYRHRDYWDLANIFPSFLIRHPLSGEAAAGGHVGRLGQSISQRRGAAGVLHAPHHRGAGEHPAGAGANSRQRLRRGKRRIQDRPAVGLRAGLRPLRRHELRAQRGGTVPQGALSGI